MLRTHLLLQEKINYSNVTSPSLNGNVQHPPHHLFNNYIINLIWNHLPVTFYNRLEVLPVGGAVRKRLALNDGQRQI